MSKYSDWLKKIQAKRLTLTGLLECNVLTGLTGM